MKKLFLKQALAVAIMLLSGIVSYAASFGKCGETSLGRWMMRETW